MIRWRHGESLLLVDPTQSFLLLWSTIFYIFSCHKVALLWPGTKICLPNSTLENPSKNVPRTNIWNPGRRGIYYRRYLEGRGSKWTHLVFYNTVIKRPYFESWTATMFALSGYVELWIRLEYHLVDRVEIGWHSPHLLVCLTLWKVRHGDTRPPGDSLKWGPVYKVAVGPMVR